MMPPQPNPAHGLLKRFLFGENARFLKFAVVGGSGFLVNEGLLWMCRDGLGMATRLAAILAIIISIFTNFLLNNYWTWSDHRGQAPFFVRLGRYYLAASVAAVLNYGLFELFWAVLNMHHLIAAGAAIGCSMLLNFVVQSKWTFRRAT